MALTYYLTISSAGGDVLLTLSEEIEVDGSIKTNRVPLDYGVDEADCSSEFTSITNTGMTDDDGNYKSEITYTFTVPKYTGSSNRTLQISLLHYGDTAYGVASYHTYLYILQYGVEANNYTGNGDYDTDYSGDGTDKTPDSNTMVLYFKADGTWYDTKLPEQYLKYGSDETFKNLSDILVSCRYNVITMTTPSMNTKSANGWKDENKNSDGLGFYFGMIVGNTQISPESLEHDNSYYQLIDIYKDESYTSNDFTSKLKFTSSTNGNDEWLYDWTLSANGTNTTNKVKRGYFYATVQYGSKNFYYFKIECIQYPATSQDTYFYRTAFNGSESYIDGYINNSDSQESLPIERTCYVFADCSNPSFDSISLSKYKNNEAVDCSFTIVNNASSFISYSSDTSDNTTTFKFLFAENTGSKRQGTFTIYDNSLNQSVASLKFILLAQGVTEITDEEDTSYYEDGDIYTCIDDNTGEPVDSTELLYKGSINNIYKTIDQKDNTLFLGNYTSSLQLNNIESVIRSLNVEAKVQGSEMEEKVKDDKGAVVTVFNETTDTYSYTPDMTLNSQQKRLFKKGESYLLGLVFLKDTGQRSSVYYVGEFSPNMEPTINSSRECTRPVYEAIIPEQLATQLSNNNIIGVIPVYALKLNYKIIAQGFLCPALESQKRLDNENVKAEYSWYQRFKINRTGNTAYTVGFEDSFLAVTSTGEPTEEAEYPINYDPDVTYKTIPDSQHHLNETYYDITEFQTTDGNDTISYSSLIYTLNSPEIEVSEDLRNSDLTDCYATCLKTVEPSGYINNIDVLVNLKYAYSDLYKNAGDIYSNNPYFTSLKDSSNLFSITKCTKRCTAIPVWYSYQDGGRYPESVSLQDDDNDDEKYTDFVKETADRTKYTCFYVYPWLRDKMGGDGEDAKIESKNFFDTVFLKDTSSTSTETLPDIKDACIYRDFDTNSIIKVDSDLYQGNLDYILTSNSPYRIFGTQERTAKYYSKKGNGYYINNEEANVYYPIAYGQDGTYAGYNSKGYCFDPISVKYKSAPHIVMKFKEEYTTEDTNTSDEYVKIVQLEHKNFTIDNTKKAREYYTWIKCGDQKRIISGLETIIKFVEGDYFYGRFDSLRTYPYTNMDPNSVTEIVSGMLSSRVNLDARTDRNRGVTSAIVSPTNFNLFNNVYDLAANYFTFSYVDSSDSNLDRSFTNTLLWTLTKTYGSEIDDWCNIQSANVLDLDGDKGQITAIRRNGNNLIAFLTLGIALILYNENTLVTTTAGVPVEIANSGKVLGKRYLYVNIGCLNLQAICSTSQGLYFIDSINKTIYLLGIDGNLTDLCATYGMKSWGLRYLDSTWRCYYDRYALEVLFENDLVCLSYSDLLKLFQSFLSYEGVYHTAHLNERLYLFDLNIDTQTFTIWKKNAVENTYFFGSYKQCKMDLIVNPIPTIDKTFANIYYRADCFTIENNLDYYDPDSTFTLLRVWNEYLDTGIVDLLWKGTHKNLVDENGNSIKSKHFTSTLKKKFRIWRILIPRAIYGKLKYTEIDANGDTIPNIVIGLHDANITYEDAVSSRDRIRNPWCFASFILNNSDVLKIKIHDIEFQYYI